MIIIATKFLTGVDLNNQRGRAFADPSAATDAVTKQYVDNLLDGLRWKTAVRAATTANGTLATAYENGDVIDGITLATGDRILIKDQTTQTENGIYLVAASGAPARTSDADSTTELNAATALVLSGTVNADKAYTQTTDNPTVGSSNIVWVQFGGGGSYTADGNGIELSGSTFALELDGTTLTKSATGLRIGSGAAGAGLIEASGVLAVGAGTGITVNANDVAIDTTVVARVYSTTVGNASATSFTVTHSLGTRAVLVGIFETATPYTEVFADVVHTSTTAIDVTFATAPTSAQYTVVVHG